MSLSLVCQRVAGRRSLLSAGNPQLIGARDSPVKGRAPGGRLSWVPDGAPPYCVMVPAFHQDARYAGMRAAGCRYRRCRDGAARSTSGRAYAFTPVSVQPRKAGAELRQAFAFTIKSGGRSPVPALVCGVSFGTLFLRPGTAFAAGWVHERTLLPSCIRLAAPDLIALRREPTAAQGCRFRLHRYPCHPPVVAGPDFLAGGVTP